MFKVKLQHVPKPNQGHPFTFDDLIPLDQLLEHTVIVNNSHTPLSETI